MAGVARLLQFVHGGRCGGMVFLAAGRNDGGCAMMRQSVFRADSRGFARSNLLENSSFNLFEQFGIFF